MKPLIATAIFATVFAAASQPIVQTVPLSAISEAVVNTENVYPHVASSVEPIGVDEDSAEEYGFKIKTYAISLNLHARFDRTKSYHQKILMPAGEKFCGWKLHLQTFRRAYYEVLPIVTGENGFYYSAGSEGGPSHNRVSGRYEGTLTYRTISFDGTKKSPPALSCASDGYSMSRSHGSNTPPPFVSASCKGPIMMCGMQPCGVCGP